MKIAVFGLTLSSSWGNGHATLWRGLVRALARRGCRVTFFERDVPYYAENRDLAQIEGELVLYRQWEDVREAARAAIAEADAAMVTSYCPDAIEATGIVLAQDKALRVFYDLDTPVTLASMREGALPDYIGPQGLRGFDLVLSYTGGAALTELRTRLGASRTAPLFGHVDPQAHRPASPMAVFAGDLSWLGTYAQDRQGGVDRFLVEAARRRPQMRFVIGGAQYPQDFPWTQNIHFVRHLPPGDHPAFFASSRMTLNITRKAMAEMGWCPSGRLFEAAACGVAILTDAWEGLDAFFEPGREVVPVRETGDVLAALDMADDALARLGREARERVLACHTSQHRADELLELIGSARLNQDPPVAEVA